MSLIRVLYKDIFKPNILSSPNSGGFVN